MSHEETLLRERFAALLFRRKVQRREKILLQACFYSMLGSFAFLPLRESLPYGLTPLAIPMILCPLMAGAYFLSRPWSKKESLRALFLADKSLGLEERALTAWEILDRKDKRMTELAVVAEAAERLQGIDFRRLFPSRVPWQAYLLLPLLVLFVLLNWFEFGIDRDRPRTPGQPGTLAQEVKEFATELKERARAEGLTESLRVASAMEAMAEKRLRGQSSEQRLREDLSGLSKNLGSSGLGPAQSAGDFAAITRESLLDLKMELEALNQALALPGREGGEGNLQPGTLGRLENLRRLSEELRRRSSPPEKLGPEGLRRLLGEIDRSVSTELDRRTLSEIREFLSLLIWSEGQPSEPAGRDAAQALAGRSADPDRSDGPGMLPGNRPAAKEPGAALSPPFKPGVAAHLRGMLKEGGSTSFRWQRESRAGKSIVAVEDLIVSYKRQAEEELASEKIPKGLKETVKNYFLSLGLTEAKTE